MNEQWHLWDKHAYKNHNINNVGNSTQTNRQNATPTNSHNHEHLMPRKGTQNHTNDMQYNVLNPINKNAKNAYHGTLNQPVSIHLG